MPVFAIASAVAAAVSAGVSIANAAGAMKKSESTKQLQSEVDQARKELIESAGLTEAQLSEYQSIGAAQANAAKREAMARESELSALYDLTGSQLQQQRLASEELQLEADAESQQNLRALDLEERDRKANRLDELEMMLAGAKDQDKARRREAASDIAETGMGIAAQGMETSRAVRNYRMDPRRPGFDTRDIPTTPDRPRFDPYTGKPLY